MDEFKAISEHATTWFLGIVAAVGAWMGRTVLTNRTLTTKLEEQGRATDARLKNLEETQHEMGERQLHMAEGIARIEGKLEGHK